MRERKTLTTEMSHPGRQARGGAAMKKSQKSQFNRGDIAITPEHWDVPLRVGLIPYADFCARMETQLQTLVERWVHTAAPYATSLRRRDRI